MLFMLQQRVTRWDRRLYQRLSECRRKPFYAVFIRTVSASGDGYWYIIGTLLATITLALPWTYFWTLALAFSIERPIYWLLKNSFRRTRPSGSWVTINALLKAHDKFSFPSGHTCAAFVFSSITHCFFPPLSVALWPWALAIGFSRVAVGVHYPTDVIAGACLGLAIAEVILLLTI